MKSNSTVETILNEKTTQFDWICNACSQKLTQLKLSEGAVVYVGEDKTLYSGYICKQCFKIECNICKGSPANAPCKWCGGEVAPAYDDFFIRHLRSDTENKVFITSTEAYLQGVGNGDLFITSTFVAFINYHKKDSLDREVLRECDWGLSLPDRVFRHKDSFILLNKQVDRYNCDDNGFCISYKDNSGNNNILTFSNIKSSMFNLLQNYSKGEKYFDANKYKEFGIGINKIAPTEMIDMFLHNELETVSYEVLKSISKDKEYMKKLWWIVLNRPTLNDKKKNEFVFTLAQKYPDLFKDEALNYTKSIKLLFAFFLISIFGVPAILCIMFAPEEGLLALLKIVGYFLAFCTVCIILVVPGMFLKQTELRRKINSIVK